MTKTVVMFALLLCLTACGGSGGDAELENQINNTTVGQELMDLKQALDTGAITTKEYEVLRAEIIDKNDGTNILGY